MRWLWQKYKQKKKKTFQFSINHRLKLRLVMKGVEAQEYYTTIQEVTAHTIHVSLPLEKGEYVYVRTGQVLQITLYESSGLYQFNTRVFKKIGGSLPLLVLGKPLQIKKFEQRKYIRTKVSWQVVYWSVQYREQGDAQDYTAFTRDISAGGLCLVNPSLLVKGMYIEGRMIVPERGHPTRFTAIVTGVRVDRFSDSTLIGMEFKDISDEDRGYLQDYAQRQEQRTR